MYAGSLSELKKSKAAEAGLFCGKCGISKFGKFCKNR
jgi:hypothetical protein